MCGLAAGGELTATFTATPSSLEEGGSSDLTLALNYVPSPERSGAGIEDVGAYRYQYYYSGYGKMTSLAGSIDPDDGVSHDISTPLDGTAYTVAKRVAYVESGVYVASVSGVASAYDVLSADRYRNHPKKGWVLDSTVATYRTTTYSLPIEASVTLAVANGSPSITDIQWTPAAATGTPFSFTVTASDPGGVGSGETLTFDFDLDDDGEFDDLTQSGSSTASGTHAFATEGTHVVRVRVTDGSGGSTEGFFTVTVGNERPAIDPIEPVSHEFDGLAYEVDLVTTVSDADDHPLTVKWLVRSAGGDWEILETVTEVASGTTLEFEHAYSLGSTSVRVEANDGYDTTVAETTVTVQDTESPFIGVAATVRVPTDPGKTFATGVTLTPPTTSDSSGREVTLTNDAPAVFHLGETTVAWLAVDPSGNRSTIEQKVVVEDREEPTILGEPIVRTYVEPGKVYGVVALPSPAVYDNVSAPSKIDVVDTRRARYPIGRTLVVFRATDEAGNSSEYRTTVVVFNRKPVARAGRDIVVTTTSEAGVRVGFDGSRSFDPDQQAIKFAWRSGKAKFERPSARRSSAVFPVGRTRVWLYVTDAGGAQDSDVAYVTVRLKNAKARAYGGAANQSFAQATGGALQALGSETSGSAAISALTYANAAAGLGDATGEFVRWEEGQPEAEAFLAYAELRALQQAYGTAATGAILSAYAETGDEGLLSAYGHAVQGTACAGADLREP